MLTSLFLSSRTSPRDALGWIVIASLIIVAGLPAVVIFGLYSTTFESSLCLCCFHPILPWMDEALCKAQAHGTHKLCSAICIASAWRLSCPLWFDSVPADMPCRLVGCMTISSSTLRCYYFGMLNPNLEHPTAHFSSQCLIPNLSMPLRTSECSQRFASSQFASPSTRATNHRLGHPSAVRLPRAGRDRPSSTHLYVWLVLVVRVVFVV